MCFQRRCFRQNLFVIPHFSGFQRPSAETVRIACRLFSRNPVLAILRPLWYTWAIVTEACAAEIINNREQRLAQRIGDYLAAGADSARLAVGYLFLDGLAPLRGQIERLPTVEILIGNVVNRLTEEQVREEAAARRRGGDAGVREQEDVAAALRETHGRAAVETALNLRETLAALDRTAEMQALLLTLAECVARGSLKVRLYTEGRIHAKAALIGYPPGCGPSIAVVGSSNLTLGGDGHPTELNVALSDARSVAALEQWYGQLWDVSQDFHRELFAELGQSWAFEAAALDAAPSLR